MIAATIFVVGMISIIPQETHIGRRLLAHELVAFPSELNISNDRIVQRRGVLMPRGWLNRGLLSMEEVRQHGNKLRKFRAKLEMEVEKQYCTASLVKRETALRPFRHLDTLERWLHNAEKRATLKRKGLEEEFRKQTAAYATYLKDAYHYSVNLLTDSATQQSACSATALPSNGNSLKSAPKFRPRNWKPKFRPTQKAATGTLLNKAKAPKPKNQTGSVPAASKPTPPVQTLESAAAGAWQKRLETQPEMTTERADTLYGEYQAKFNLL